MKLTKKFLLCCLFILFTGMFYDNNINANARGFHFHSSLHEGGGTHEGTSHEHTSRATHDDETANPSNNHKMSAEEMSDNATNGASDKDIDTQTKINHNDNKNINNNNQYGKYNELKKPADSNSKSLPYWYFVSNHHLNNSDSNGYYHNRLHELKRYYNRIKIIKRIPNPVNNIKEIKNHKQIILTPNNVYSNYYQDIYPNVPILVINSQTAKQFIKENDLKMPGQPTIFNQNNHKFDSHVIEEATIKYQNKIKEEIKLLAKKINKQNHKYSILITILVSIVIIGLLIFKIWKFMRN